MIPEIGYLILGIILLFVPGFLLSFLLFRERDSLSKLERILVSIGLSGFIDMLIITILAQPSISALTFMPVVGSILIFCVVAGVIIFFRQESRQTFYDFLNLANSGS